METHTDQESRDKVFDLIKDIQVTQLVTTDGSGRFRARPMVAQQEKPDGILWFLASAASGKLDEIESNKQVLLVYSDPRRQNYVNVRGNAEVVHDRDKIRELWSEPVMAWFPKGADDQDIALIKVEVEDADYWDSPSGRLVHAYGRAAAEAAGVSRNAGDNKHVEFDGGNQSAEQNI